MHACMQATNTHVRQGLQQTTVGMVQAACVLSRRDAAAVASLVGHKDALFQLFAMLCQREESNTMAAGLRGMVASVGLDVSFTCVGLCALLEAGVLSDDEVSQTVTHVLNTMTGVLQGEVSYLDHRSFMS